SLGLAASSTSSGVGSWRTTTRRLPSGAHSKVSTSWTVSVSFWASPPRRLRSQTWVLPSLRAERKAKYLPSGLQRGWDEETLSAERASASPPAAGTIQMRFSRLSLSRLVVPTVKATHWPSGLSCGSCTVLSASTSSTVNLRLAVWPETNEGTS